MGRPQATAHQTRPTWSAGMVGGGGRVRRRAIWARATAARCCSTGADRLEHVKHSARPFDATGRPPAQAGTRCPATAESGRPGIRVNPAAQLAGHVVPDQDGQPKRTWEVVAAGPGPGFAWPGPPGLPRSAGGPLRGFRFPERGVVGADTDAPAGWSQAHAPALSAARARMNTMDTLTADRLADAALDLVGAA